MRHIVRAVLENLKQLEAKGLREETKSSRQRRTAIRGKDRGHQLVRVKANQWRCKNCLSVRRSKLAYRWPKACSALFQQTPLPKPHQTWPTPFGGDAHVSHPPIAPVAVHPMDDPEAADPFDCLDQQEEEEDQQFLPPEEDDMPPADSAPVHTVHTSDPLASLMPALSSLEGSWWNRVGEVLNPSDIRVGGAPIHHTHWLGWFGNSSHRLTFCLRCGGCTAGSHSPLLAVPCKLRAAGTRSRHLQRMVHKGLWPSQALQTRYGRAVCSHIISFAKLSEDRLLICRPAPAVIAQSLPAEQ